MSNIALGRTEQAILTNKSGGSLAQGDVVIVDSGTASSVTTTTTSGYTAGRIGVVVEPGGIANNALGMIAFSGYVPKINLSASASLGDLVKTHTVAKQGVRHAAPAQAGDFAQVLETGASPKAILFGSAGGVGTFIPDQFSLPVLAPDANTNFSTVGSPDSQGHALLSAGTLNNEATWNINLPSGTYTIIVSHTKGINRGVYHLYVAGVDVGNFDGYNGSTTFVINSVASIVIAGGVTAIKLKMEAKNGSSSDYFGVVYGIDLKKTA